MDSSDVDESCGSTVVAHEDIAGGVDRDAREAGDRLALAQDDPRLEFQYARARPPRASIATRPRMRRHVKA